jgi:hypothetical protein
MFCAYVCGDVLADSLCGRVAAPCGRDFRQAKVENLGVTALSYENVGRFDVAMDDSFGVSGIEGVGNLNRQSEQNLSFDGFSTDAMLLAFDLPETPLR